MSPVKRDGLGFVATGAAGRWMVAAVLLVPFFLGVLVGRFA